MVSSLKKEWTAGFDAWGRRDLSGTHFTSIYADGVYQQIRGDNPKLCALVIVGSTRAARSTWWRSKTACASPHSPGEVLLDLKSRGMKAPALAVGDGALGFWAALREVFGTTTHQRCWFHKSGNVMNYLPKSIQTKARSDLSEIWMAPSRAEAQKAIALFRNKYEDEYPKAVTCITEDAEELLTFDDFPAVHWPHIRTTNAIESTFATLRHRTVVLSARQIDDGSDTFHDDAA